LLNPRPWRERVRVRGPLSLRAEAASRRRGRQRSNLIPLCRSRREEAEGERCSSLWIHDPLAELSKVFVKGKCGRDAHRFMRAKLVQSTKLNRLSLCRWKRSQAFSSSRVVIGMTGARSSCSRRRPNTTAAACPSRILISVTVSWTTKLLVTSRRSLVSTNLNAEE